MGYSISHGFCLANCQLVYFFAENVLNVNSTHSACYEKCVIWCHKQTHRHRSDTVAIIVPTDTV